MKEKKIHRKETHITNRMEKNAIKLIKLKKKKNLIPFIINFFFCKTVTSCIMIGLKKY